MAATKAGQAQAFNHLDKADTFNVDITTDQLEVDDFDAIVLPGGVANPDQLRTDPAAVGFVRAFFDAGKPVAAICHGPWTLVEADVVRGRTLDVLAQSCRRTFATPGAPGSTRKSWYARTVPIP